MMDDVDSPLLWRCIILWHETEDPQGRELSIL